MATDGTSLENFEARHDPEVPPVGVEHKPGSVTQPRRKLGSLGVAVAAIGASVFGTAKQSETPISTQQGTEPPKS